MEREEERLKKEIPSIFTIVCTAQIRPLPGCILYERPHQTPTTSYMHVVIHIVENIL